MRTRCQRWHRYTLDEPSSVIPHAPGVYAVFAGGRLLYVGSTTSLYRRLFLNHLIGFCRYSTFVQTPWGVFPDVAIRWCGSRRAGDWLMREYRLVRRLAPQFNVSMTDRARRRRAQ